MSARFRGTAHRALIPKLPRNLVVFDGHCLLCQERIRFVVERNFSFFGFLTYFSENAQQGVNATLDRHALHFASLDSVEGSDVKRLFLQKPKRRSTTTSTNCAADVSRAAEGRARGRTPPSVSPLLPFPDDLVVVCVEKIPSKSSAFLRRAGGRVNAAKDDAALFKAYDPADVARRPRGASSARPAPAATDSNLATSALMDPETTDLFVTTNYLAMCRIGMHLDRVAWRTLFTLCYYCVPRRLGSWVFDRVVCQRRHSFWGHSEEDAVKHLGRIEGMKERRWSWRTQYTQ